MDERFTRGINVSIKIPKNKYEETLVFYREILHLDMEEKKTAGEIVSRTHQVKFGANIVWLDCVDNHIQKISS